MPNEKEVDTIPLMKGTARESSGARRIHGVAEVKPVLIDCTDGNGVRSTLLAFIAGNEMVVVENNGKPAQQWLKDAVFAKLRGGGTEQV
jgi:hypothetical protein